MLTSFVERKLSSSSALVLRFATRNSNYGPSTWISNCSDRTRREEMKNNQSILAACHCVLPSSYTSLKRFEFSF